MTFLLLLIRRLAFGLALITCLVAGLHVFLTQACFAKQDQVLQEPLLPHKPPEIVHEGADLSGCSFFKTRLADLAADPQAKWLYACNVDFQTNDLPISSLANLQILNLTGARIHPSNLTRLRELKALRVLTLNRIPALRDSDWTFLQELRRLEYLSLSQNDIPKNGIAGVSELRNLLSLFLANTSLDNERAVTLGRLTNLRRLDVSHSAITRLDFLVPLTSLETLNIRDNAINSESFVGLRSLLSLKRLDAENTKTNDQTIHYLAGLKQLEWLNLSGNDISDSGVAHLQFAKQLEMLFLRGTQVTGTALASLASAPLKTLDIGPNVTDKGLTTIAGIKSLEALDLSGNPKISDQSLNVLSDLPALRSLVLKDCNLTDAAATAIIKCKQLAFLDVTGTRMTNEVKAKITESLPHCLLVMQGLEPGTGLGAFQSNLIGYQFARAQERNWDFDIYGAIDAYSDTIAIAPGYSAAYGLRGILYAFNGDNVQALHDVERAVTLSPRSGGSYGASAKVKSIVGDCESAIAGYDEYLRWLPGIEEGYRHRAELEIKTGNSSRGFYDLALAHLIRCRRENRTSNAIDIFQQATLELKKLTNQSE